MEYLAISFYQFFRIEGVQLEVKKLKKVFSSLGIQGRIYLAEEGVNAQISLEKKDFAAFTEWKKNSIYADASLKVQPAEEHAFQRLTVKERKQLCAFDVPFSQDASAGEKLSPQEWKKMLDQKPAGCHIIDVRNDYESEVGHFKGAIKPPLGAFREFPGYTEELEKTVDKEKDTVLMYCTGGIRCEYYASYLKNKGFRSIYQLDGGVIQYANEVGAEHWKGKLFVFDDRLTVALGDEETLSHCIHCGASADTYYNCANMDCNALFTSCHSCASKMQGLCQDACKEGRVRAFDPSKKPKPFPRLSES